MEGFSFVTPVTGLNRPNTGKKDDDDDTTSHKIHNHKHSVTCLDRLEKPYKALVRVAGLQSEI
jgi:hypothetical protein